MKHIHLKKRDFPGATDGSVFLPVSLKALIRAAVTAGQKPAVGKGTAALQADRGFRIGALRSAVSLAGAVPTPTPEFLAGGRTDKAHKSFYVGNSLCSHAAYTHLDIPWLADIERLDLRHKVRMVRTKSNERPDFLGRDRRGRWFVFESKGRSNAPSKKLLEKAKGQARMIRGVNESGISANIVSMAYINRDQEWELLWVDPPVLLNDGFLELDEFDFFQGYYAPLLELIEIRGENAVGPEDSSLRYLPEFDAFVGLHPRILEALAKRNVNSIRGSPMGGLNRRLPMRSSK